MKLEDAREGVPVRYRNAVLENIEAFAVAIAMALVIRHFSIEAFRIPTGSMKPTLYGDISRGGVRIRQGDRILVDKFGWVWGKPRRFQVSVFKCPMDASRNFIKRLMGLPGEWLTVREGDVWISHDHGETWFIPKKPRGVRDQLFFPYYPKPLFEERNPFHDGPNWLASPGWTVDEASRTFRVAADSRPATLRFARSIPSYDSEPIRRPTTDSVGDVRVRFSLDVQNAGTLTIRITDRGHVHKLVLGAKESHVIIGDREPDRRPLDLRLRPGGSHDISFASLDQILVVGIDGEETEFPFPHPDLAPPPVTESESNGEDGSGDAEKENSIEIEAAGLKATLKDIAIARDIYYGTKFEMVNKKRVAVVWKIPEGHYFMMGDNSVSSLDSRFWWVVKVQLKDGSWVAWAPPENDEQGNPQPGRPGGPPDLRIHVERTVDGLTKDFRLGDVARWESSVAIPFVPHKDMIGRAFAVFWPIYIPGVYNGPTRIQLIH